MSGYSLILTTAGSREEAQRMASSLVERELAACVNIVSGVQSFYRWEGKLECADEWLLLIKTTESGFSRVREAVNELHSYELPECICIEIKDGSPEYLKWIADGVR